MRNDDSIGPHSGRDVRGLDVVELGRPDEDVPVEVSEHPFGARLGAVDGDDAEVLGSDLLNAGMDRAANPDL